MMKKLRESILARFFTAIALLLPRSGALSFGRLVGWLIFKLDKKHRLVCLNNLDIAFGDTLERRRKEEIVKNTFRNFGAFLFELLRLPRMSREKLGKIAEIKGLARLKKAYGKNKGVLLFTAHLGNWELMGIHQGTLGFPLNVVARPLDNHVLNRMLDRRRTLYGNRVIKKRNALPDILRALRKGEGVAILIDQNVQRKEGVFVDFFGKKACTTPALAAIALRTGAAIIPAFAVPTADGKYLFIYEKELIYRKSGDHQRDILEITARATRVIEDYVRRYPDCWLWMHRRWKTRPVEEGKDGAR
jgi:KDO2-lipid IV(A) lauroyltransferase